EERLRGKEQRGREHEPWRQAPEGSRRGGEEQDRAGDAADDGNRAQAQEPLALPADLVAEACRAPGVAGPDPHGVGDVGRQGGIPKSQEEGERNEASPPRHAVDDAGAEASEEEKDDVRRGQCCRPQHRHWHGREAYGTTRISLVRAVVGLLWCRLATCGPWASPTVRDPGHDRDRGRDRGRDAQRATGGGVTWSD